MKTHQIVGLALTVAGVMEFLAAHVIVGPRIEDARVRSLVARALTITSVLFCGFGLAVFYGFLGAG